MSTLICSFDGLHDNRVLRYCADFKSHSLHMDTQTEAGEKVSVHFTGLLAHWFENVVQDNILFGMDEISVDAFFEQYKDLLAPASREGSRPALRRLLSISLTCCHSQSFIFLASSCILR